MAEWTAEPSVGSVWTVNCESQGAKVNREEEERIW